MGLDNPFGYTWIMRLKRGHEVKRSSMEAPQDNLLFVLPGIWLLRHSFLFLFQNIGESVLSSLVKVKPCIDVGS
jgi:hypothetical protein